MKTLHLSIILMVVSILIVPSVQNAKAIPYFSPQEIYKLSDMAFHGEVISKQEGPGLDYYYQIKVDTYFKNPQNSDSITVAGHKPGSPRAGYPQFEVGDKAIFYIRKIDGINTMYYGSQKAGNACDIHSFLGPAPLPGEKPAISSPASNLRLLDVNGNAIIGSVSTNHKVVLHYDDIWNSYPESRMIPVETSILDSNSQTVFYKKQNLEMQACDGPGIIKWDYIPIQSGRYAVTMIVDNKTTLSTIFEVKDDYGISSLKSILSPLKQFKSGIATQDVKCKEDFMLITKASDGSPACVKPETAQKLIERRWTQPTIIPSKKAHEILPLTPNNTVKPLVNQDNQTSSTLKLFISTDSTYTSPGNPVGVDISLNNTSSTPLILTKSDNWPRNDLSSGPCSNLPFGMAILKGYYTEQNMSNANSLVIFQNIPCPLPAKIKSYTFQPLSSKAIQECDSLFSCTGLVDMKTHLEISGFVDNNSPHRPFSVGTYTIIAGDQWGHVTIQHFSEAYTTPLADLRGN